MPDRPTLVRNHETGRYGVYHPEEDIIETYVGGEKETLPGAFYEVNYHDADPECLTASIEADIQKVRDEIDELRGPELTLEQERELEALESRAESLEKTVQLHKEVLDDAE